MKEELNTIEKVLIACKKAAYDKIWIPDYIKKNYEFKFDTFTIEKKKKK
jgi:hypothetical protein